MSWNLDYRQNGSQKDKYITVEYHRADVGESPGGFTTKSGKASNSWDCVPFAKFWTLEIFGQFYSHGLTLIPTCPSNHMPSNVWDEITYPFLNFNGATVEV